METVQVRPMQWGKISDIDEVSGLSAKDLECFRELRDVLRKYEALDRFGVTLIHKHFDIAEDEALVEFTDVVNRRLVTMPVKASEIDEREVSVTNWQLAEGDTVAERRCICRRTASSHVGTHLTV